MNLGDEPRDQRRKTGDEDDLNGNHMIMVTVVCAIALVLTMAMSRAGETPIYGPDGIAHAVGIERA